MLKMITWDNKMLRLKHCLNLWQVWWLYYWVWLLLWPARNRSNNYFERLLVNFGNRLQGGEWIEHLPDHNTFLKICKALMILIWDSIEFTVCNGIWEWAWETGERSGLDNNLINDWVGRKRGGESIWELSQSKNKGWEVLSNLPDSFNVTLQIR